MRKVVAFILLLSVVLTFASCSQKNPQTRHLSVHPLDLTPEAFEDFFGVPKPESSNPFEWPPDLFERIFGVPQIPETGPFDLEPLDFLLVFGEDKPDSTDPLEWSPRLFEIIFGFPRPDVNDPLDLSPDVYEMIYHASYPADGMSSSGNEQELEPNPAEEFEYTENYGSITITKYIGNAETVVIPAKIDGNDVIRLGVASFSPENGVNSIKHVVISEGISYIDDRAFAEQSELEDVYLPFSMRSIKSKAFMNCTSLSDPVIRGTSLSVGFNSFAGCSAVKCITFESGVRSGFTDALVGMENLTLVVIGKDVDNVEFDPAYSLYTGYSTIENVEVDPENECYKSVDGVLYNKDMTELLYYPRGNTNETYTVPDTVKVIGKGVGQFHHYIQKVIIPEGVTTIKDAVFAFCVNLAEVYLPASVETIGQSAFSKEAINSIQSLTVYVKEGSPAFKYADKMDHQYKFKVSLY